MTLRRGDRFDRYVIAGLLGEGGMGEVYEAEDTRLQRPVALKILRTAGLPTSTDSNPSTDGSARLMREARAAAALEHPNAVAVFDVGVHDGMPYLAMEFISGKSLRHYIGDPSVPMERRLQWLRDVARALAAAHKRGLVHRDIKPENVMVRDDGVVKVLDFGIARRTPSSVNPLASTQGATFETLTGKGVVVGTPQYMAPEQMRGEQVDGRTDIFAWGTLAYELLTGRLPWEEGTTALQLVSQILSAEPDPPSRHNPQIDAVILHSLAKTPQERHQTMEVIVDALEPFANISASMRLVRTTADRVVVSARQVSTRSRIPVVSSATSERPAAGRRRLMILGGALTLIAAVVGVGVAMSHRDVMIDATGGASTPSASTSARDKDEAPASQNPDAVAAYRAGVQAYRDAAQDVAREEFDRAVGLDPEFAAAHLRRALVSDWSDVAAREHFKKASQLRDSALHGRDLVLLDAFEPWVRFPPDPKESEKRLSAATIRYPTDPEFGVLLCQTRASLGDAAGANAACDAALKAEPTMAAAFYLKGAIAGALDDLDATNKAFSECLSLSPTAVSCLRDLIDLDTDEGKCDDAVQLARRLIAADPRAPLGYMRLARAIYGSEKPVDSVRLALQQGLEREPNPDKVKQAQRYYASLDILQGDFAAASEKLKRWDQNINQSTDELEHFHVVWARMQLALEKGDNKEATQIADEYLRLRMAWAPALAMDLSIYPYVVKYLAGTMSRAELQDHRAKWLAAEHERPLENDLLRTTPGMRWIVGYAFPAVDDVDANAALAALAQYQPLPGSLRRGVAFDDAIGEVQRLSGNSAGALASLQRAWRSCGAVDAPLPKVRSGYHLGLVLEAKDDSKGACEAYRSVVARWGQAKPRSVTAEKAKARIRALGCPAAP